MLGVYKWERPDVCQIPKASLIGQATDMSQAIELACQLIPDVDGLAPVEGDHRGRVLLLSGCEVCGHIGQIPEGGSMNSGGLYGIVSSDGVVPAPAEVQNARPVLLTTRHKGALEWLRRRGWDISQAVTGDVAPDDPRLTPDTIILGVAPYWLAARVFAVAAIEFAGKAPRGAEYTADDMDAAGARLRVYQVREVTP